MRLDALPAALRDVSNRPAEGVESPAKRRRRSSARPRRVSRALRLAADGQDAATTPRRNLDRRAILQYSDFSPGCRRPKRTRLSQGEVSLAGSGDQSMVTLQPEPPTMQIDYSPCPLRTTKSLIALRRRLEDTFSASHRSVGSLPPAPSLGLDNPLYYTLTGRITSLLQCPGDDVPAKMRRRNIVSYSNDIPLVITPGKTLDACGSAPVLPRADRSLQVSALTHSMAKLNLNSLATSSSLPLDTSAALPSRQEEESAITTGRDSLGVHHDATDPRFLSQFPVVDSTLPLASDLRNLPGTTSRAPRNANDTVDGTLAFSLRSPRETGALNTSRSSQRDKSIPRRSDLSSSDSLRRSMPVVPSSEEGASQRPHHREAHDSGGTTGPVVSRADSDHAGGGGGSADSLGRSFSLRRQGGFRRRQRPGRGRLGLTLAKGIPSPSSEGEPDAPGSLGVRPLAPSSPSSSDETWNSHSLRLLQTPRLTGAACTSPASAAPAGSTASPVALVERRSRSRRCLTFASPGGSTKQRRALASRRHSRDRQACQLRGELELAVYANSGLLTIHVIRGWNLHKNGGNSCNAYVKVNLVPSCEERTFHRTSVQRDTSDPWFDQKFSFEVLDGDLDKRVLVSVWHRDKDRRRSEFLGCMSFAVKHAVKKDIGGSFRLLSQSSGQTQHQPAAVLSRQSVSSCEQVITATPKSDMERRKSCSKKPVETKAGAAAGGDDSSFLRHLELEPADEAPTSACKGGRTPFTTTRRLSRHAKAGFGFSIAWTQPPRVERVEAGQAADRAGLRPGDYVIFVEKCNVVTMPEEEILDLIRSSGDELTLEVYRRAAPNGLVSAGGGDTAAPAAPSRSPATTCSATSASLDLSKRRLHLPQVTFSSEVGAGVIDSRRRAVCQLLAKEQQYAVNMQYGLSRFLLPLADRRDLLSVNEHLALFQNAEELLRLTEDISEMLLQEEGENFGQNIGRIYLKKMGTMNAAYRRYFSGIKKADCLLAAKTRSTDFMRSIVEPPVPRRRPDLTAFLHKPLEHYREVLKLLQTILNTSKVTDDDYPVLARIVQEMQVMYREVTTGAGLMEPEGEGRPLLSLQDLESRLVFTRCKPFVLRAPGRQWLFGGDLSRVEGRAVRPFWALLFTDLILFAKVSRDRVLFITEEPLPLLSVTQAFFNIRKKANDFRLVVAGAGEGVDSPAPRCGPELQLSRHQRRRPVTLRAPSAELKAVWQNLIQRQIIYLNTIRGGTPASSPLDSPDPPTTLSVATLDSLSLRRQTPLADCGSQRHLDELIEHRCRRLGKSGSSKGSALHLAQWIKGQLGGAGGPLTPEDEPEPEVWSPETLRRRSEQLNLFAVSALGGRNESRCEEIDMSDTERSQTLSTSDSQPVSAFLLVLPTSW
ncbi:uncharacterized protein LOC134537975 [Bacillus rossius redtenbacheri]|uniref:uncharacterized protein LOC134537975 n=1 Tax=Bacillus rossius redtenbacheri TaxID=93214 RepID=UPI002FDCDBC4